MVITITAKIKINFGKKCIIQHKNSVIRAFIERLNEEEPP